MKSAHPISVAEPEPVGAGLYGRRQEPEPKLEDDSGFTHTMFKKLKNTLNLGHLKQTNVFKHFIFLCII